MRSFWKLIALLVLVLFAPASMHCLMGADVKSPLGAAALAAGADDCGDSDHGALPQSPEHHEHHCPTDTLAKSSLPVGVMIPEMPSAVLDDALAALRRIAAELLSNGDALTVAPAVAPKELQTSWAFASRAALPARWPSELA